MLKWKIGFEDCFSTFFIFFRLRVSFSLFLYSFLLGGMINR